MVAIAVMLACAIASERYAVHSYHTLVLLHSAYGAGTPQTGSVRSWMTLGYVAATYHVPEEVLTRRLGLPAATTPDTRLRALADQQGMSRSAYVEPVQRAIGEVAATPAAARTGWLARLGDTVLGTVLVHGYATLAVTYQLASLGVPVPDAVAVIVAGSLEHHLQRSPYSRPRSATRPATASDGSPDAARSNAVSRIRSTCAYQRDLYVFLLAGAQY
ncbi:hypothetical protein [Burkholderia aenigmatica]|uniref:hypothetical protein n=1 Tax=Burkholderia aenigmatica TaxID=2015348 RepID=UPI001582C279|nr:hypothetical protein [Burkholderia aenigmatica]